MSAEPADWYREDDDPFGVGTRWYERRKRALAGAALLRERYQRVWDAASGTGHLVADLMPRCSHVVASDAHPRAVELTRARLQLQRDARSRSPGSQRREDQEQSEFNALRSALPQWPRQAVGSDLVVLSEVLYYLDASARAELPRVLDAVTTGVPCAEVLAVTWAHHPHDGHLSGAGAHDELAGRLHDAGWHQAVAHQDQDFLLHSWIRSIPARTSTSGSRSPGPDVQQPRT